MGERFKAVRLVRCVGWQNPAEERGGQRKWAAEREKRSPTCSVVLVPSVYVLACAHSRWTMLDEVALV